MRNALTLLLIAGVLIGSVLCPAQIHHDNIYTTAESATEVTPDPIALPAEIQEQLDRLFDPNEVYIADSLQNTFTEYAKGAPDVRSLSAAERHTVIRRRSNIVGEVFNRLRKGLTSENFEIKRRSALELHALGDSSGVPVMIDEMSTGDPNDRGLVVIALRKMKDNRAIDTLIKALDEDKPHTRCIAAEALGELRAAEAYDALTKHINDKEQVRGTDVQMFPATSAIYALGEIGDRKAVPLLIKALEDESLTDAAAKALDKIRLGPHNYASVGRGREAFGADKEKWTDWWNWQNLDGTEVVARIYPDYKIDPAAYEKITVKVKSQSISFKDIETGENSVIAVVEDDQANRFIRKCLKNHIYAFPAKEDRSIHVPNYDRTPTPDKFVFFQDALGNTIADATVEIWLYRYNGPRIKITEITSDGSFKVPEARLTLQGYEFVLFHPDYGNASVSASGISGSNIPFPLIHRQSPAASRAIEGVVTDPEGNPIANATILSSHIRTLGEGLINANGMYSPSLAITDANGYFRTYMPPGKQFADQRGKLIPPKSKYSVRIEAPKHMDFLPFVGQIENGAETTIVMDSPGIAHTLVFADAQGIIEDPAELKNIVLTIDMGSNRRLSLNYDDWKNRKVFPNGTYVARYDRIQTDPVQVTDDSPVEIFLKTPDPVTYTGRVVDGVTGQPFAGALVVTMQAICSKRLADITPAQWAAIHALGDDISPADPVIEPINDAYRVGVITRTDAEGFYSIQPQPGRKFYTFLAFDENYIPVSKRMYLQKPGDPREVTVETLKLYPAAKILLQACVEEDHISICPRWIVDKAAPPTWVPDLIKYEDRQTRFVRYDGWIEQNEPQNIFVPADTTLQLKLRTPYDDQWSPYTTQESYRLAHGEVLDIGRVDLAPSLKVYVRIVNAHAEPVEGVPVRKRVDNQGSVAHTTDENGRVMFYVPAYSSGTFYVSHYARTADESHMKEELPYQLMGTEDNESEFTLQLSDQILLRLFDSTPATSSRPVDKSKRTAGEHMRMGKIRIVSID